MGKQNLLEIKNIDFWMNRKDRESPDWALVLPQYKLVYLETYKAACSKIRVLLILLNRGYDDPELAEFLKTTPAPYYHWEFDVRDNQNLSRKELTSLFHNSEYFKFAFARNPYDRLVSAYKDKISSAYLRGSEVYSHLAKEIKAEIIWNSAGFIPLLLTKFENIIKARFPKRRDFLLFEHPEVFQVENGSLKQNESYNYEHILKSIEDSYHKLPPKSIFENFYVKAKKLMFRYPDFNSLDLNETPLSFKEFVEFVCNQNIENMNSHWQPQTYYIGFNCMKYDFIGRVETFDKDIQYVFDTIKAPKFIYSHILGKINKSKSMNNQKIWTDELASMVYDKYKVDFEAFGYDKMSYRC
jgi:hypothetical protein